MHFDYEARTAEATVSGRQNHCCLSFGHRIRRGVILIGGMLPHGNHAENVYCLDIDTLVWYSQPVCYRFPHCLFFDTE